MNTIYCDEAGNTGANLLDPEQPMFILSSNDLSSDEANDLLEHVRGLQGGEPKFSVLRRRPEGIARIIRLLSDPRLTADRVRASVYHKRYMVVTKLVDLVMENVFHAMGRDLYRRGENIATANMLFFCMPAFCGEEPTNRFLQSFVNLIRQGPTLHKDNFYRAAREMVDASSSEQFKSHLSMFAAEELFPLWFHDFDWSSLDPAIPALFHQIVVWGGRKQDRFHVLHDRSKPILASQATFESMLAGPGESSEIIGPDRRRILFPLRAATLSQGDSTEHPQLQIADLCAGALNHFYKLHVADLADDLSTAVDALGCLAWGDSFILPQPQVTPQALDTDSTGGSNSVDAMVRYLHSSQSRRPT